MPTVRTYLETHPWLTFNLDMQRADPHVWMALGEIQSKCEHLAGTPLNPDTADRLHQLYLAKGVMATAAIEGNTLSEDEVARRIAGDLKLPPSKEYLGTEIDNVVTGAGQILKAVVEHGGRPITVDDLRDYNRTVLANLETDDETQPGEIRRHRVGVARYRGAPPEDCAFLLEQMCEWLNGETFRASRELRIVYGVLRAIMAHLYIAWIHPFGDGNGRTARLVEVRALLEAGAPSNAAHLLSNHYNQTRSEYYRQLDYASRSGGDTIPFIKYAVNGLCEQLREQIGTVRRYQYETIWKNYVHERFEDRKTPTDHRRRDLMLAISDRSEPTAASIVRRLTPQLAELYAAKTHKTIIRDLNALVGMGLLSPSPAGYVAAKNKVAAFLPHRTQDD